MLISCMEQLASKLRGKSIHRRLGCSNPGGAVTLFAYSSAERPRGGAGQDFGPQPGIHEAATDSEVPAGPKGAWTASFWKCAGPKPVVALHLAGKNDFSCNAPRPPIA